PWASIGSAALPYQACCCTARRAGDSRRGPACWADAVEGVDTDGTGSLGAHARGCGARCGGRCGVPARAAAPLHAAVRARDRPLRGGGQAPSRWPKETLRRCRRQGLAVCTTTTTTVPTTTTLPGVS